MSQNLRYCPVPVPASVPNTPTNEEMAKMQYRQDEQSAGPHKRRKMTEKWESVHSHVIPTSP